jgi:hypothetical protein
MNPPLLVVCSYGKDPVPHSSCQVDPWQRMVAYKGANKVPQTKPKWGR